MTTLPTFFLLTTLLSLTHLAAAAAAYSPVPAPAPGPAMTNKASDYIRSSCSTTLYPELCYHSLFGYANAVQQDPARLARVAIGVSLSRARRMVDYLANVSRDAEYGSDARGAAAVHDCASVFGDAVDQIRESLRQMRRLRGSGEEVRFQMSNVQTWMSAALTNEDTCTDGFEDVGEGSLKADVCDRTVKVKEVTSNALALANSYAAKITL